MKIIFMIVQTVFSHSEYEKLSSQVGRAARWSIALDTQCDSDLINEYISNQSCYLLISGCYNLIIIWTQQWQEPFNGENKYAPSVWVPSVLMLELHEGTFFPQFSTGFFRTSATNAFSKLPRLSGDPGEPKFECQEARSSSIAWSDEDEYLLTLDVGR